MPKTTRPAEVDAWVKKKVNAKHIPAEVDGVAYSACFLAWWTGIQPEWRLSNSATAFNKVVPPGESLGNLGKGGPSGLYTIVMGLSWWIRALDTVDHSAAAWSLVDDVKWVIQHFAQSLVSTKKRSLPEEGKSTKYVIHYFIF